MEPEAVVEVEVEPEPEVEVEPEPEVEVEPEPEVEVEPEPEVEVEVEVMEILMEGVMVGVIVVEMENVFDTLPYAV